MKKILASIFLLTAFLIPISAQTQFFTEGFMFSITSGNTVKIVDPLNYTFIPSGTLYHYQEISTLMVPDAVKHPVSGDIYSVTDCYLMMNDHITEIVLPATCKTVGISSFPALKKLDIPDGVEAIGDISNLPISELILPKSLRYIKVTFAPTLSGLSVETLIIPEGVKTIKNAIVSCDNLTTLEIKGAKSIGPNAISSLTGLKKLILSPELENVTGGVALDTDPEEIWFPSDGVERPWKLSVNSFVCHAKRVYCARLTPPTFDGDMTAPEYASAPADELMFYGPDNIGNVTLYVPAEAVEAYKATPNWRLMNIQPYNFQDNIPMTAVDATAPADTTLYDLHGRVVTEATPAPGIYIRAGRKVIVR